MTSPALSFPRNNRPHVKPAVVINPIKPNRHPRAYQLSPDVPVRTDGLGGWTEVTRPHRESLTEYTGPAVDKLDVPIICDGFPNTSVQSDVDWLVELGRRDGEQSPVFRVTGPIWMSGAAFVLSSMEWGDFYRRDTDGHLVRQHLILHCWRYVATDTLITSAAKHHQQRHGKGHHPKTYVVHHGDTLRSIANKFYGDPSKWHQIADANHMSIAANHHLKPGRTLKLP